ncbi:hypothetical protein [Streptosporangium fragile]
MQRSDRDRDRAERITDRRTAIRRVPSAADVGDVVLSAGKGAAR